ncbi:hypothetical protein [Mucilaginibacter gotjawali]|uniref:Uncharacterized protein n=2 Tax=Mucilaginibacter gotjawali TaxID=1550579 RepID=A0A839SBQ4_9SPHI|nr:hypothetical protein [Mucilaginibacter gotjawali]MBB3055216.1 hypothetical protein [Mucilaginibacter gotjawali]BAU56165.1 hypothetical protein MgSA37_04362 [Mucilaginibacter gotjawali]
MTTRQKGFFFFGVAFIIIIVLLAIFDDNQSQLMVDKNKKYIGKVQFKGKVINSKIYSYAGKPYFMICVKLDFSNFRDLEIINEYCFLKIKNNIATVDEGVYSSDVGVPKYVEVNIGNSGVEKQLTYSGDTTVKKFYLPNWGLSKSDLNICN